MENIIILYGGKSGEHDVSRRSAASVLKNLDTTKFIPRLIGITNKGQWFYQTETTDYHDVEYLPVMEKNPVSIIPASGLLANGEKIPCDAVLPILHGTYGEDGTIQGLLELLDIPYAGAGILGSALSLDKDKIKSIWQSAGIPIVPYITIESGDEINIQHTVEQFGFPMFIKPARTGSSVGVHKVETEHELNAAVKDALRFDTKVLIEKGINAREIECSVMGNRNPECYPPGEIIPSHDFYDYEAKYTDPEGAQYIIPANVGEELLETIKSTACKAYQLAEAEGLSRVDFFLDKDSGTVYLNEINTIPGFTDISMFSKMCEAGGLPYTDIITKLIELAKERYRFRSSLEFSI